MTPSEQKPFIPPHLRTDLPRLSAEETERCRAMTTSERFQLTCELTSQWIRETRQALRDAHPDLPEAEIRLLWVEQVYGKELADELRMHFKTKGVPTFT